MLVTSKINVDLTRSGIKDAVYAVQNDGCTRAAELSLFDGKTPWAVPSDATAVVGFKKPDGTSGLYDTLPDGETRAVSVEGHKVTAVLAPQVLTCPGRVDVTVALYDSSLHRLGIFPFPVFVSEDPSGETVESEDYYWISVLSAIGDLSQLQTTTKENLVSAVNELITLIPKHNFSGVFTVRLADDGGNYTASSTYYEIADAHANGKLVLLQYGMFVTHILAGAPTEDCFLFEPLLHSVPGMPGYIVDMNDNWNSAPLTQEEEEPIFDNYIVVLEQDESGEYISSASYMEIAGAREAGKLVLLRYGVYLTHILAGEPTESSFLFEPLLHSVPGMPGYIVDSQDNWNAAPVSAPDDGDTDDGNADPWNGNAVVIYGVSDDGQIYNALMTGRIVYCLYNDMYYLPLMSWDEGSHTAIFGGCYGTEIITCTAEAGEWSAKTTDVSTSEPEVFVGTENTTLAEFKAAYDSGKTCFLRRSNPSGAVTYTAYNVTSTNAFFFAINTTCAIVYAYLDSNNLFTVQERKHVTTIDQNSTDDQIPTAKAVYEVVKNSVPDSSGLTATEKSLILTLFRNAAYTSPDMNGVLTQLEALWSGSGGETGKTLTSISATYSGGDVAVGTAVTDLTGIVVTAHYSDGTSEAVTGYILSGTIAEGSNTVTVSYGGKTTTFTVTGTAESGGSDAVNLYSGELLKTNNINDVVKNGNIISYTVGANGSTATFTIEGLEADKNYTIFVDTDRAESTSGKYCVCYITTEEHAIYTGKIAELRPGNYGGKDYATFTANGNTLYLWFNEVGDKVVGLNPTYTVHIYEGTLTERP